METANRIRTSIALKIKCTIPSATLFIFLFKFIDNSHFPNRFRKNHQQTDTNLKGTIEMMQFVDVNSNSKLLNFCRIPDYTAFKRLDIEKMTKPSESAMNRRRVR